MGRDPRRNPVTVGASSIAAPRRRGRRLRRIRGFRLSHHAESLGVAVRQIGPMQHQRRIVRASESKCLARNNKSPDAPCASVTRRGPLDVLRFGQTYRSVPHIPDDLSGIFDGTFAHGSGGSSPQISFISRATPKLCSDARANDPAMVCAPSSPRTGVSGAVAGAIGLREQMFGAE
jgi:hypothetical protein